MKLPKPVLGDFWGGLAAMLVALPSAIAFGVTIYAPLGTSYVAQGALAGILGVMALGLIAPAIGGTNRLISAPCAPAAAVLSAFAIEFLHGGGNVQALVLMLALLGLFAGLLQILFGTLKLGRLIEYMPYPVVSGYLSGVGLTIIISQVPKFLGASKDVHFLDALTAPGLWKWQSLIVGCVTIAVMLLAPRYTRKIPAAIIALLAGIGAYFALGLIDHGLLSLQGNAYVVGSLGGGGGDVAEAMGGRWQAMRSVTLEQVQYAIATALTLAVLLSIDTLKTCVVLDALTHSRHNSNQELIGQGAGNVVSALIGGMPGAGTMGATLVNMSSGAQTRYSGIIEGMLGLVTFLLLGSFIAWVPVSSLAAILIVIGVRMIDRHSFEFLKQRSTISDFLVIAVVIYVALTVSLIAASGSGVVLAILLFIREQIGGNVVRRKVKCNETFSKRIRTQDEMEILVSNGDRGIVVELQGSLFFGTVNQLYSALEAELKLKDFVILDMRRVQSVDVTAVHMLDQIRDILGERKGFLIFSQLPVLPSGRNMQKYFDQVGLVREKSPVKVFGELDEALEWVEDRILSETVCEVDERHALQLQEFDLFNGRKAETIAALEQCLDMRTCKAGEKIFSLGDKGDELFLIRKGAVRIMLPISKIQRHHLGTFGRGAFFGEMSFLDGSDRSADAEAFTDTELFILSRKKFETLSEYHKKLSFTLMESIATALANRLRYTNAELRVLEV